MKHPIWIIIYVAWILLAYHNQVWAENKMKHESHLNSKHICYQNSLQELAVAIQNHSIRSRTCVDEYLHRIEKQSPHHGKNSLNAIISINLQAIQKANHIDDMANSIRKNKPLLGVPLVIKDNINTIDMATTGGTPALKHNVTHNDAEIITRLKAAGAIILAKANLHELGLGVTSNNVYFGPVRNPHDLSKFAGGSSGGVAAAVAAGLAPAGLGTDTSGSVRIPAALTGIVGFRPSTGRYPNGGIIPIATTLDTVGLLTRTVTDSIYLDSIITETPIEHYQLKNSKKLRLGIPQQYFYDDLDPAIKLVMDESLVKLMEHDISLISIDVSQIAELTKQSVYPIFIYEFSRDIKNYLAHYAPLTSLNLLITQVASPDVKQAVIKLARNPITYAQYKYAIEVSRPKLQAFYKQIFNKYKIDAIVIPTTPLPAKDIENSLTTIIHNHKSVATVPIYVRNTLPAANAGIPAVTIPMKTTGLPMGLELDGQIGQDQQLLAIAQYIESIIS